MRRAIVVATLWASTAHADDALRLHTHGEASEPFLHFDPILGPMLETPLAAAQRIDATFDLGETTTVALDSEHWIDATTYARGVTAGLQVSRDFGFARLVASGSVSQVESRFGSGTDFAVSLALVKTRRFSRWTTGWISLGLEYRSWAGQPSAGVGVMLRAGFTFR